MVIVLRASMVVIIGALLLALPVMSGALPPAFFNGTTVYFVDCTVSNPNGAPDCKNVPYQADISYKFGPNAKSTQQCPGGVCTDANININKGVWLHVPNNFSVKNGPAGWVTAESNAIVCWNIPELQRAIAAQAMTNDNVFIEETSHAQQQLQFCIPGHVQDCPLDSTGKHVCPTPPFTKAP